MSAGIFTSPVAAVSGFVGLKSNSTKLPAVRESIGWSQKTISNGSKTYCMKVNIVDIKLKTHRSLIIVTSFSPSNLFCLIDNF